MDDGEQWERKKGMRIRQDLDWEYKSWVYELKSKGLGSKKRQDENEEGNWGRKTCQYHHAWDWARRMRLEER